MKFSISEIRKALDLFDKNMRLDQISIKMDPYGAKLILSGHDGVHGDKNDIIIYSIESQMFPEIITTKKL